MATYPRSILLRVTEDQHKRLTDEALTSGQSVQNYVRGKLFEGDPTATANSTPTPQVAAYAALAGDVRSHDRRFDQIEDQLKQVRALLGGKEA